jgi:LPXTG-motif cell wall-anchored protein
VYNLSTFLWSCCGVKNGTVACPDPTDKTFLTPAPSNLLPFSVTATSGCSTAVSSLHTHQSSLLSTGAEVGIGISVAAGIILLAFAGWFTFAKRRKGRYFRSDPAKASSRHSHEQGYTQELSGQDLSRPYEIDGRAWRQELASEQTHLTQISNHREAGRIL